MSEILVYSQVYFPVLGGLQRNTDTLQKVLQGRAAVKIITETMEETGLEEKELGVVRTRSIKTLYQHINLAQIVIVNGGVSLKACLIAYMLSKEIVIIYQTAEGFKVGTGLKRLLLTPVRKWLASKAKMNVIQTSAAAKMFVQNILPYRVIQNPVDPDLLNVSNEGQVPIYDLLFAGRVIEEKGIFLLMEALITLRKKGTFFKVAIAGDGISINRVKEMSVENDLEIVFLGNIDNKALVNAYQHARFLIVPTSGHMEGSPLVISEAISFGTPVIVSDQPAMIEAVGAAGVVFKSGNKEDLQNVLTEIASDPLKYRQLKSNCAAESSKFSPVHYREAMLAILQIKS